MPQRKKNDTTANLGFAAILAGGIMRRLVPSAESCPLVPLGKSGRSDGEPGARDSELPAIRIGTQEMLLSRGRHRVYGAARGCYV